MKIWNIQLPRSSGFVSAVLWLLLLAFIGVNTAVVVRNQSMITSLLSPSIASPFSIESHIQTALALWNNGYQGGAKQEIRIADDLFATVRGSTLGVSTAPSTLLHTWESQPKQIQDSYEYWKEVAIQKPQYRDGLIMAGLYAYQLGEINQSRQYLQSAYAIDPNYAPLNMILEKIGK